MSNAAHQLLAAFESLKGSEAIPEDHLEAQRIAGLPIDVALITARMRAIAERNGPTFKPARLKYFAGAIDDLVRTGKQPTFSVVRPDSPHVPIPEGDCLTPEEHRASLAHLRALQTPEQLRRVDLVKGLKPRPNFKELQWLLGQCPPTEFAARLDRRAVSGGLPPP
jgi:hypothetical protein